MTKRAGIPLGSFPDGKINITKVTSAVEGIVKLIHRARRERRRRGTTIYRALRAGGPAHNVDN